MALSPELISALGTTLSQHQEFIIISHPRPDGDAYGSTLGLGLSLQATGKNVQMVNEDGLAKPFAFLPGSKQLMKTPSLAPAPERLFIAVDTADALRLGPTQTAWKRLPEVNIDHHVSNPGYAKLNLIDAQAPATAEVLYEIISNLGLPLTPGVAANLYVGLMTDTGSFRYRQTTARSFAIAAKLVEAGADPTDLAQQCYQSFPPARLLLLREVLNAVQFSADNRIAWFRLTPEMYAKSGATSDETEGLLEHLQAVQSVEVAFLIEAMPDGLSRVSLRSRGRVDVQKICQEFGGGGHRLAAGLRSKLDFATLEERLLDLITRQFPA